jgi:hypothetical protein
MADRIPTFADVCNAIAEGQIAASIDGAMYQLNAFELRRYLNKFRSLPIISTAIDQNSSPHSDSDNWAVPVQTSVA